jgi:tetratricopeptide (TPR) repeat protein
MLETMRRYSIGITLVLLILCGAVLLTLELRQAHARSSRMASRARLERITGAAYRSYQNGLGALQDRNDPLAEQEFRRSLQADPQNPAAWLALADILKRQKKSEEALACFRTALRPHPEWNPMRINYWRASGQVDPESVLGYAELCESLGNVQEATAAYAAVVEAVDRKQGHMFPKDISEVAPSLKNRAYLVIALWRNLQGRQAEASSAYAKAGVPKALRKNE